MEFLLRRDSAFVLGGIVAVTALAWVYIGYLAQEMTSMGVTSLGGATQQLIEPQMATWGVGDFALMFMMWAVMMVAMMMPSAAPMMVIFARVSRTRRRQQRPYIPTSVFISGYLGVWTGFAVVATLMQWGLHSASLLSPMMVSKSTTLGGALLIGAGMFQWTPLKYACISHCRNPLAFLLSQWREGPMGALRMGVHHGIYCLGCCWIIMGLLFVLGVMNLLWIAALAAFVLVEKLVPAGMWGNLVTGATGFFLVSWGAWVLVGSTI